jgi:hypothetical protein
MRGDGHLAAVEIVNYETGAERTAETPTVFSFIGAGREPTCGQGNRARRQGIHPHGPDVGPRHLAIMAPLSLPTQAAQR